MQTNTNTDIRLGTDAWQKHKKHHIQKIKLHEDIPIEILLQKLKTDNMSRHYHHP